MHYQICEAKSARVLQEEVCYLITKGWRPIGGVSVVNSHNTGIWWYYQAMVINRDDLSDENDESFANLNAEFV